MVLVTNVTPSIKDMSFDLRSIKDMSFDLSQSSCNENGSYGSLCLDFILFNDQYDHLN